MTVRVGVIGTGNIGQDHIRRLTETISGAAVSAVTDIDHSRAREVADRIKATALPTGADVIGSTDVDAVLITSWGPTHAEHVLNALAVGKPVFCEKPLAKTAAECLRIVEVERSLGRRLVQVGFMRRFDPGYRCMKEIVSSGSLGAPLMVHCVHRNPSASETYTSAMAAQDTAVHEIDVLRWMLSDEIVSAQVITPRATRNRFPHLADPQIMYFQTVSGVRIDLEVFVNCGYGYDIQCEIVGEEGLARLPDPPAVGVRTAGWHGTTILQGWQSRFAEAFDAEFRGWIASIEAGTEPPGPSAWDGYAATVVTEAAVRSLETGGHIIPVDIKPRPLLYQTAR